MSNIFNILFFDFANYQGVKWQNIQSATEKENKLFLLILNKDKHQVHNGPIVTAC